MRQDAGQLGDGEDENQVEEELERGDTRGTLREPGYALASSRAGTSSAAGNTLPKSARTNSRVYAVTSFPSFAATGSMLSSMRN